AASLQARAARRDRADPADPDADAHPSPGTGVRVEAQAARPHPRARAAPRRKCRPRRAPSESGEASALRSVLVRSRPPTHHAREQPRQRSRPTPGEDPDELDPGVAPRIPGRRARRNLGTDTSRTFRTRIARESRTPPAAYLERGRRSARPVDVVGS